MPNIKAIAKTLLPDGLYARWHWYRAHRHQRNYVRRNGLDRLGPELQERFGDKVLHGPFAGMIYPRDLAAASSNSSKVLGSYEAQLAPFLTRDTYQMFVEIGSAEGYFVVGMARLGLNCIGFEIDARQRKQCLAMARINGVSERIQLKTRGTPEDLELLSGRRCLVLCDCDGFESRLFTPRGMAALRQSDCIIELHEELAPGVTRYLQDLFRPTHALELIDHSDKAVADYPEAAILGERAQLALCEQRPFQQWLIAKAP
jgi:hypothetical protein